MIKTAILDTLMWPMRIPVPVIPSPVDRDYSRYRMISVFLCGVLFYFLRDGPFVWASHVGKFWVWSMRGEHEK